VAPAAVDALQAVLTHQAGDALAADSDVQAQTQLGVHAWRLIGPAAACVDLADLLAEQRIRVITVGRRAGAQA
jgi:hypothetical protein